VLEELGKTPYKTFRVFSPPKRGNRFLFNGGRGGLVVKILFVTDPHGEEPCIDYLKRLIKKHSPDAVLLGGDFERASFATAMLEACKVPAYAVHGNMDNQAVVDALGERYLHEKTVKICSYVIGGLGGSNPTPFNTPMETTERKLAASLKKLGKTDVLLSHAPPFNTFADELPNELHVGSKAVRGYLLKQKPLACLCGHVHETQGVEKLGKTLVCKAAPLMQKTGFVLELPSLKGGVVNLD